MPASVYNYIAANGLATEDDYPYVARVKTCTAGSVSKPKYLNAAQPYVWVNGTALMVSRLSVGPISITVDARNWWPYASGIFNGECSGTFTHAVVLYGVGSYGTLGIKNSWGWGWGE